MSTDVDYAAFWKSTEDATSLFHLLTKSVFKLFSTEIELLCVFLLISEKGKGKQTQMGSNKK